MTVLMKAKKAFAYAGHRIAVDAQFVARGKQDARILAAIGNAEVVKVEVPVAAPVVQAKASARAKSAPQPIEKEEPAPAPAAEPESTVAPPAPEPKEAAKPTEQADPPPQVAEHKPPSRGRGGFSRFATGTKAKE